MSGTAGSGHDPVEWPPLYAILDADACARAGRDPLAVAEAFLAGGVTLIQWRAKSLPTGASLDITRQLVRLAGTAARIIVNDRADVAALAGAAGVHVGQEDLAVPDVRAILGGDAIVGLSTHTAAQVRAALDLPISYVAVGPVFGTATKETGYAPVGLDLVESAAALCASRGVPVVAIGGITLARAPAVLAAGAGSVCVIGDLLSGDPAERARAFVEALGPSGPLVREENLP